MTEVDWKARALAAEAKLKLMPPGDPLRFSELREANVRRCSTHYHPIDDWSLMDWLGAVTGELGELAGVIKNIRRREAELTRNGHQIPETTVQKMGDEAADVVIYLDLLCARARIDLAESVRRKFNDVSMNRLGTGPLLVHDPLGKPNPEKADEIESLQQQLADAKAATLAWMAAAKGSPRRSVMSQLIGRAQCSACLKFHQVNIAFDVREDSSSAVLVCEGCLLRAASRELSHRVSEIETVLCGNGHAESVDRVKALFPEIE